jgi:transcription elongation factor Elf1
MVNLVLSEPIDVYSEWIDACEGVHENERPVEKKYDDDS